MYHRMASPPVGRVSRRLLARRVIYMYIAYIAYISLLHSTTFKPFGGRSTQSFISQSMVACRVLLYYASAHRIA